MLAQISIGLFTVVLSILIQVILIEFAVRAQLKFFGSRHPHGVSFSPFVITLSAVTLWLLVGLLLVVLVWTLLFLWLGAFSTLEESFYFSLISFTTLGFGDVILPTEWRILSGFLAMDGFLIFGLNTAVILEFMRQLRADSGEPDA